MNLVDIILLIIIAGFAMFGFWFGLIHTFGSLLGTLLGAFIAGGIYQPMGDWLISITGWGENISYVVMFTVAFVFINRMIGFGFWVVEKSTDIVTKMPFIQSMNRFFGTLLGIFEGLVTVGLVLLFIEVFPLSPIVMNEIEVSWVAPIAESTAGVVWPLMPEALESIQEGIDAIEDNLL